MNTLRIDRYTLGIVAAIALAGCDGHSQATTAGAMPTGAMAQSGSHQASGSYGYCPANPSGTGILPDGDFSQGANYGDEFIEPSRERWPRITEQGLM